MKEVAVRIVHNFNHFTIPKPVREILGLRIGDALIFMEDGDGSVILRRGELVEAQSGCASS